MGYIGPAPASTFQTLAKQDFTTSATTSYTLSQSVSSANDIALFINNVRQEPTYAYGVSGTALTLTEATSSSDDMYCIYLGKAISTIGPSSGSVGIGNLSATGTKDSTTFLRGDNTFAEAGGGKILQVVQNWDDQYATYSNTSVDAQATVLSQAITPSATSSKILIQVNLCVGVTSSGNKHYGLVMYRGSTEIGSGDKSSWNSGVGATHSASNTNNYSQPERILTGLYLDSPNTTSSTTYNIKSFIHDFGTSITAKTLVVNGGGYSYNNKETSVTSSSLTLWEIGA